MVCWSGNTHGSTDQPSVQAGWRWQFCSAISEEEKTKSAFINYFKMKEEGGLRLAVVNGQRQNTFHLVGDAQRFVSTKSIFRFLSIVYSIIELQCVHKDVLGCGYTPSYDNCCMSCVFCMSCPELYWWCSNDLEQLFWHKLALNLPEMMHRKVKSS